MRSSLYMCVLLTLALAIALPLSAKAEPAFHDSIEWATANADRVIIGKVIKAAMIDKHAVVTVDVTRVVRGEHHRKAPNPDETFLLQEYCSGYAKGWLEDGLPMIFFLVKIDGTKRRDGLPQGFDWV